MTVALVGGDETLEDHDSILQALVWVAPLLMYKLTPVGNSPAHSLEPAGVFSPDHDLGLTGKWSHFF